MRILAGLFLPALLAGCSVMDDDARIAGIEGDVDGTLFVANKRGDSLSRIDLATGRETARADTCANPHELAVSPDGRYLALACYGGSSLALFQTENLEPVSQIELGSGARPHGVIWHPGGLLLATAEGRGSIFAITDALSERPQVQEIGSGGDGPHMLVVDSEAAFAWGTVIPSGTVVRYDLKAGTEIERQQLGGETEAIALTADGGTLWVAANAGNRAYRLDPNTLEVRGQVVTGEVPIRLAPHPEQNILVSSNFGDGSLTVIDSEMAEAVRDIPVSGDMDHAQVTLIFSANGERLYAAETATDTIAEIDFATGEVLRRIPTGPGGDGMAVLD